MVRRIGATKTLALRHNHLMPNIAAILKAEISRVARKELRVETASLKKTVMTYRSEIASLKRRLEALERQTKQLGKRSGNARLEASSQESDVKNRFSARGLATHRQKLGLSALDYGKLIGASSLSVYKWEKGNSSPRAQYVKAIAAVRGMGKKEAAKRLEELR